MPLLRNTDKSKMSKRKNPTSLDWYREQGFLPEAMVNFLALMGFSMGEDREVFSLSEFIANFDLKRVGTGAPVFDMTKLEWLNGEYIRGLSPEDLARRLREGPLAGRDDVDDATLRKIVPLVRERMKKLSDFGPLTDFLFAKSVSPSVADMVPKKGTPAATADALEQAAAVLQGAAEWQAGPLEATARQLCDRLGWKPRDFFMPIRVAVTGSPVSPPLFESVEVLGREKTLARLRQAAAMLKSASGC
jgi:glutamyl-tRNA synthetase